MYDGKRCVNLVDIGHQPTQLSGSGQKPTLVEVDTPCGGVPVFTMSESDDKGVAIAVKVIDGISGILMVYTNLQLLNRMS